MPFNIRSSGSYYATFDDSGLSANRTYTLPNQSGALLTTSATASQAVTSSFAVTASYALSSAGGGGSLGAPAFVVTKTATESVVNSSTTQPDNHLFVVPSVLATYRWELWLYVTKFQQNNAQSIKLEIYGGNSGTWSPVWSSTLLPDSYGENLNVEIPNLSPSRKLIKINGVSYMGQYWGFELKWAQGTNNSNGVQILAGSQLIGWTT